MPRRSLMSRGIRTLGNGAVVTGAEVRAMMPRRGPAPRPPRAHANPLPTRVLGLDLAARCTGWCLLVGGMPAAHGSFILPDRRHREMLAGWMQRRADELGRQVAVLVSTHRPDVTGFEVIDETRPSWSGGSKGREMVVSQALGRAQGVLVAHWPVIGAGTRLVAVPIGAAKQAAIGRVNANKDQVRAGLMTSRGWDLIGWTDDETDAAAVALVAREMDMGASS